jgi:hypothetical protein
LLNVVGVREAIVAQDVAVLPELPHQSCSGGGHATFLILELSMSRRSANVQLDPPELLNIIRYAFARTSRAGRAPTASEFEHDELELGRPSQPRAPLREGDLVTTTYLPLDQVVEFDAAFSELRQSRW